MNSVVATIDISRRPEDVFAYATDFAYFPEWQAGVRSARPDGPGPIGVGSSARVTRRVGPRVLSTTERVTELSPPRRWVVRDEGGLPITAFASGIVEPLENGDRSRVILTLDFKAHGFGKLMLPLLVRPTARRALRRNVQALKATLEKRSSTVNEWGRSTHPAADQPRRTGLPRWVPLFNGIARPLLAVGVPMGPDVLITVRGRKTALPRTTPVTICENAGRRGPISAFGESNCARNLRAARTATLTFGRSTEEIAAIELGPTEAVEFIRNVLAPHARRSRFGRWFVRNIDKIDIDNPEEAASGRPVFEIFPLDQMVRNPRSLEPTR